MQWNLRMVAAQRGIRRASDLRRLLAEAGLEISGGRMSYLWSGQPISVRLDDLEVICRVLDCQPNELLVRDPAASKPNSHPPRWPPRPRSVRRRGAAAAPSTSPKACVGWLEARRHRWPARANPHLPVDQSTAGGRTPVTRGYIQDVFGRLGVTAEDLRVDRLLAEAEDSGGDPLTLTLLFGISDPIAIRYCAELSLLP